jgi:hypothetical protein
MGIGHTMHAAATAYTASLARINSTDLATYIGILNDALAALTGPDGVVDELLNERSLTQYQMGQKALKDAGVWA